ncbi:hypothetical protein LEN26_017425 [Aphanomyces euteiches]|nr:hypothetical protein LEN26_017425 [Aphanomyces euteiches]KAH9107454.1 hypothetical protein AeMF1_017212 [Aphanomyces euteiches]KAH9189919.1 hypothetical protein AeNC1_008101 [Aphanomyces euteiches]
MPTTGPFQVVLYYRYVNLTEDEVEATIAFQQDLCASLGLSGRVRLSEEGINGTLGGTPESIQAYIDAMASQPFSDVDWKLSTADELPFNDLLIRRVKEIVSIELPDDECRVSDTGIHLKPEEFHAALESTANAAVIDVRNNYEFNIGHFKNAMNPSTRRFGQFPQWVRDHLEELQTKDSILMYCTGGIRCEKASAYLKHLGLSNVYQLQGGIHRYLEAFPDGGAFVGKNFVFDQRVAMSSSNDQVVGHCQGCDSAHDVISGIRCSYCRMHVMLCTACDDKLDRPVFCHDHEWMGQGTVDDLALKLVGLESKLTASIGPKEKGHRRSIRKQMDAIQASLDAIQKAVVA